ncbi:putative SMC domain protein [Rickettsia hoogstraalii str. RCCE3]|nr:putative SMC domain protein [Rickettsia hoogstraalii str. RCCE3]
MSREFLKISSTLAEYIQEYFDNPNSDLSDIQRWFNENIRGSDQLIANRSKVSAIWLYKQLKQYKSNILNQKLVKEALDKQLKLEATQIVDYFTSQQDSAKIILLYSKYKQGYKSLKTGQEVHRQASQLRKTINKSIAEHLKVNLDIDDIKKIQDVQFKQKIFNKIHEQRLGIIKDYLKDIGYNKVTPSITIDEIKNIIQDNGLTDSKLGEYIEQIYNQEVIHEVISDTECVIYRHSYNKYVSSNVI